MEDLTAFLRARLDKDERVARKAHTPNWSWYAEEESVELLDDGDVRLLANTKADAQHIARHDPSRVLAEVDAKRRLLTQFELRGNSVRRTVQPATGGVWDDLLRILGLPYAGHPDYREEWRP